MFLLLQPLHIVLPSLTELLVLPISFESENLHVCGSLSRHRHVFSGVLLHVEQLSISSSQQVLRPLTTQGTPQGASSGTACSAGDALMNPLESLAATEEESFSKIYSVFLWSLSEDENLGLPRVDRDSESYTEQIHGGVPHPPLGSSSHARLSLAKEERS